MKFLKGCLSVIGGLVVLLIVAGLFFSVNDNSTTTTSSENSNSPSSGQSQTNGSQEQTTADGSQEQSATSDMVPLGTLTDIRNDRAIQIESSEIVDSIATGNEFIPPVEAKGGKLVIVYMTLQNTGQESGNIFWTTFQLVDGQERTYDEIQDFEEMVSIGTWLDSQGLESGDSQLFPGGTAQTAKVFRVAPDAENLNLVVNGQTFAIQ